jgi:PGF-pre-PGF domain-containing protein/PGF-CTERM protein
VTFTEESTTESITFEGGDIEGEVTVAEYDSEPEETGASPGRSVAVTQIEVPDPDQSATIRKRVSADRLEEIEADAGDLRINRFDDEAGEWQALDTEAVETTDEHVVLEAETPGFSFFSVSAVSEPAAAIAAPGEVEAGEEFRLDASDSSDEYGDVVAHEWHVAGETLTGETVTTAISDAGEVTVELTVENDAGETTTTSTTVTVVEPGTEEETRAADETESDGADETDSEAGTDTGEDTEEQDGFGLAVAFVALLAAALFARRRV